MAAEAVTNIFSSASGKTTVPVSYTHLDVYKRQQRYIPVLTDKQWVTETVPLNVNGEGAHTFSLENLFNKHSKTASEQPVSYTHLDVNKRQPKGCNYE